MVGRPARAIVRSIALLGGLAMLTSCSDSWPESLDPSDWYAAGVGEEAAPTSDEPVPGADADYPNLAEVPDAPTNVSTAEQIDQVANALAADLANAQYSTDLQRVDDETTPEAMPLPQPEVVDVAEDAIYIEPGGEIDIAEEQVMPVPEAVEAPAAEAEVAAAEVAAAEVAAADTVVMAEMEQPQPEPMSAEVAPVAQSRVETETIRGEDGELVGTVTRVVVSEEVAVDAAGEPVAVVEATPLEVVETDLATVPAEVVVTETEVVAQTEQPAMEPAAPPAEEMIVAEPAIVVAAPEPAVPAEAAPAAGQSLVAMSERDPDETIDVVELPDQVVVVPEYVAELAPAEVTPLDGASADASASQNSAEMAAPAMEGSGTGTGGETRIEQQTVIDSSSGELIGSVTRTTSVTTVTVPQSGAGASDETAEMTFTEVAETLAASSEPQATVAPVVTTVPETVAVTGQSNVTTVPAQELEFGDLISASGPDAGAAGQPIVIASAEPVAQTQAVFTTQPGASVNEVLAAIIRFGDGSSSLGAAERDIVRQLVQLHRERGGRIRLVGHASRPAGGMETAQQELVNFNISLDRATAVAEELIRQGVPRNDVIVEAAGDNQAGSDAAQDRRVDVLFGA